MELVPEHVVRALVYVRLLNDRNVEPPRDRVDDFARTPPPEGPRSALSVALTSSWMSAMRSVYYAAPVVDYWLKVGWAEIVPGPGEHVRLTQLGQAVALGLEHQEDAAPGKTVTDVVLEPEDPLVYVHLTRQLAQAGAGMLVDPYFKADWVQWLVDTTTIRRVLVSSRHRGAANDLAELAVALATVPGASEIEIRETGSKELHDRCVIGEEGTVRVIGSSVTGIGKNLTSVIFPTEDVARVYHDKYETIWKSATLIQPQSLRTSDTKAAADGTDT